MKTLQEFRDAKKEMSLIYWLNEMSLPVSHFYPENWNGKKPEYVLDYNGYHIVALESEGTKYYFAEWNEIDEILHQSLEVVEAVLWAEAVHPTQATSEEPENRISVVKSGHRDYIELLDENDNSLVQVVVNPKQFDDLSKLVDILTQKITDAR